jgi:hypothetical protein
MAYFHLLPFGVGAPEAERGDPDFVSLKVWSQHVLRHHDPRFRQDRDLLFTMYNILRVRQTCWEAKSYIQQGSAASLPVLLQNATHNDTISTADQKVCLASHTHTRTHTHRQTNAYVLSTVLTPTLMHMYTGITKGVGKM